MSEKINIVPVICRTQDKYISNLEIIKEVELNGGKAKFCIALFSSIYSNRNITVELLLRDIDSNKGLNIGKYEIVNFEDAEKVFTLFNDTTFLEIETSFPNKGKYTLEVYLSEGNQNVEYLKKGNEDKKDLAPEQISATIFEVK